MIYRLLRAAILSCCLVYTCPAQTDTLTETAASRIFDEALRLSQRDGGDLWGVTLYGPMLLVEPSSRRVVANESADPLEPGQGLFAGRLPDSVGIANTSLTWAGREWTMLMWPMPEDPFERRALIAHELWHRVQDEIGLPGAGSPNLHLGTRDGRTWLRLESRALAAALRSQDRDSTRRHLGDALVFRAMRMQIFPKAKEEERVLLMHEGLAQYTGYALSGRSPRANRKAAALELERLVESPTFVRSFAYPFGAAYGLLLDALDPTWRDTLAAGDDLARLAGRAAGFRVPPDPEAVARGAADRYAGSEIFEDEDRRESARRERLQSYRRRFVEGPTLRLPFRHMSVQFDPRTVDALDDIGRVYPSLRLTDDWGTLSVDGGALIPSDWSSVVVPVPVDTTGRSYSGEGYRLELKTGWTLAAGERPGDLVVMRSDAEPVEVEMTASDGVRIYGDLYLRHARSSPLILLFHQAGSNARAEYGPLAMRLLDAGFNLLAIDQRLGGSRLGGENRTVAGLEGTDYSYCDAYADLEAALSFATDSVRSETLVAWGSSYSAALVFRLAAEHPDDLAAVLAFSPASGDPMRDCEPEPFAARLDLPVLVLRPAAEMELERVSQQAERLELMGHAVYVADPAVHGSSMLNAERVSGDTRSTWKAVLEFLATIRAAGKDLLD